jgi:hypothetical protein
MAKSRKMNGYKLFVLETHRRKMLNGELTDLVPLFTILDPDWRALPEEVKNDYKTRAKAMNGPRPEDNAENDQHSLLGIENYCIRCWVKINAYKTESQ